MTAANIKMEKLKTDVKMPLTNDIKDLTSYKQVSKIKLDLDSPRMQKAMFNLGITIEDLQK